MKSNSANPLARLVDTRRLGRHYAAIQGLYWANIACTAAYAVVLLQSRGISNTQIGIVMAIRALASVFLQPFLATLADKLSHRIPLKYFGLVLTLIAFAANLTLLASGSSFVFSIIIFMVLGAAESVLAPINDALAIQYINGGYALNYSVSRGIGSLMFALNCLALAGIVGLFGVDATIIVHAGLLVAQFFVLMTFHNYPGPLNGETERSSMLHDSQKSYRQILSGNPALIVFLTAAFLMFMGASAVFQYLPNFIDRAGGTSSHVGVALFVLAAVQFPTSLVYSKIARKVSARTLLLVAYLFVFVRSLMTMILGSPELIIVFMMLDLLGGGLQINSEVFFINENVGPADVVKGQSLLRIIPGGVGAMLGSLLAGYLIDTTGLAGMTWTASALMVCSVLILAVDRFIHHRRTASAQIEIIPE